MRQFSIISLHSVNAQNTKMLTANLKNFFFRHIEIGKKEQ